MDKRQRNKIERNISKAKVGLIKNHPFFAQIVLSCNYVATDQIGTFATDGTSIWVNLKFAETLSVAEIEGVLAHECLHILGKHHTRKQNRDHSKWNTACDYAINDLLLSNGFTLPYPRKHDTAYKDMTAENIYNILPDEDSNAKEISIGEIMPANSLGKDGKPIGKGTDYSKIILTPEQVLEAEAATKELVSRAAEAAKAIGKLPGFLKLQVEGLLERKTPWYELLRQYMIQPDLNDYSWNRPNRRFVGSDTYLPSTYSDDGMGMVVVGVDMSGSISMKELQVFVSEVKAIVEDARPSEVRVVYFDSEISHVDVFNEPTSFDISMEMHGGGGTDFVPIFEYIKQEELNPDILVMLTDLYGPAPIASEVEIDTVWACLPNSSNITPFGNRVDLTF